MDLFFNLNGRAITSTLDGGANATIPFEIKGGQNEDFRVQSHRDGTPELLPTGSTLLLGFKLNDDWNGSYLTSVSAWTVPDNADGFYTATASFSTSAIDTAISGKNAIEGVEAEFQFTPPAALLPKRSLTFPVTIANWVNHGSEGETEASALALDARVTALEGATLASFNFLTGIVDYTGGGSTKLDGQTTVGIAVGRAYLFFHPTDKWRVYELVASSAAESSPDIIRPDDYNGATNIKVFESRN